MNISPPHLEHIASLGVKTDPGLLGLNATPGADMVIIALVVLIVHLLFLSSLVHYILALHKFMPVVLASSTFQMLRYSQEDYHDIVIYLDPNLGA